MRKRDHIRRGLYEQGDILGSLGPYGLRRLHGKRIYKREDNDGEMLDFGFYNMDCMEGMKEFPDKYFDLAIVDPPYGIGISNNIGRRKGDAPSSYPKAYWDNKPPDENYFRELFRVSKNQIVWGAITLLCHRPNVLLYGANHIFPRKSAFQCVNTHGAVSMKHQKNGLA